MLKSLTTTGETTFSKDFIDLLIDLVKNIALLGKTSFNKSIGIEPIVLKVFIPILPILLKQT